MKTISTQLTEEDFTNASGMDLRYLVICSYESGKVVASMCNPDEIIELRKQNDHGENGLLGVSVFFRIDI